LNCVSQDPAYGRLKDYLIASTGLAFYADRDKPLTELIGGRLSDLGLRDCSSYAELLADDRAGRTEMDVLIAQLTIGETYFFRDEDQFAAIRDIILPEILDRKQSSRQLRIWSAGCATGAEPYSLAILLMHELADRIAGWQIGICATDLNRSYLAQAAEGKFQAWALRSTPDEVKRKCFSNEDLTWTIHPRYKQWISFHQMNLIESEFSAPLTTGTHFDLILCRNVMIYFSPEVNRRLVGQFHQSLGDEGWLVVGASEHNLENYRAFRTVNATGAMVYQKIAPDRPEDHSCGGPPGPQPAPRPASPQRSEKPTRASAADQEVRPTKPPADMEGLRQLADRGDWQAAAEYSQRLLTQDRLNPAIHFYQALILENLGSVDKSERSLRQAIYLDRKFALAHYHLGLALKRDRQMRAAARSFGNVLKVLAGMPDHAMVTAGHDVTVTGLKELARMHLENSGGS
jgi:chemotaxis protein methyltransferase CheR